ncbi:MAG: tyrosine-type recombinase/integrase [bacterium]
MPDSKVTSRPSAEWQDSGFIFTTPVGTPLDPRNVSRDFHALLSQADVPRVRFHDLRHTAATLLLAQGVDPRTIRETLGHSQISLTMNTYSHVDAIALERELTENRHPAIGQAHLRAPESRSFRT